MTATATSTTAIVWLRRDLRIFDNAALYTALKNADQVVLAFVFDTTILAGLPKQDRRVEFIWEALKDIKTALRQYNTDIVIRHGDPLVEIPALAEQYEASAVYCNRDYEPAAIQRDRYVAEKLKQQGRYFNTYKDQVIFEQDEVLTQSGTMYSVFSPYKRAWLTKLDGKAMKSWPVNKVIHKLMPMKAQYFPSLKELGFAKTNLSEMKIPLGMSGGEKLFEDFKNRIDNYKEARDFPAVKGVSYLSAHLRFGTVSIRELVSYAFHHGGAGAETWLSELIWREFYQQILWHRPDVAEHAFKPEYDDLPFPNHPELFAAWCRGETGYPLVDAAMRQLNQTGYMHNRLRMVVASFLVKDLLIDWRWGEKYFAEHLLDFDLAANNGGWQWAASTGCDAQPYFRIFNPVSQSVKFDPSGKFIRRYCPELADLPDEAIHAPWEAKTSIRRSANFLQDTDYFPPIVDHAEQREAALALFKGAKGE
ncbi:deoxyribodipyrimidine photo-lyase [Chitinibacter bivalviorum]|uniref:Deoxyribodipyrimidine photo-lyase n=1 Tax=Chitinibacter bivalviorum TaxID=2739434 RepID=A0A7H9BIJ7_9NEIS|nr:deoxyribodipyrimidine photo-lyase [Chitinibacter bivalviorum]QLG88540.1 deoxyribodipyrimidine photo-lyase [Chitinibacter bivalviorum]